jgi:hypothetical protein
MGRIHARRNCPKPIIGRTKSRNLFCWLADGAYRV